jgi:hypothetical protein
MFYCDCGAHEFGVDLKEPTKCMAIPHDFVLLNQSIIPSFTTSASAAAAILSSSSSSAAAAPALTKLPSSTSSPQPLTLGKGHSSTGSDHKRSNGNGGITTPVQYCSICTQVAVRPVTTNGCDHMMCYTCISSWASHVRQSCPLCRQQFTSLIDRHSVVTGAGASTTSTSTPLIIPLTVMNHGRHAHVAWRHMFKEQWISERVNAKGWTAYVSICCLPYRPSYTYLY